MAEDPVFKAVLHRVQDKVDEAFSATGRRRTGKNSPWVQLRAQIQAAKEYQNHCAEESNKTKAIDSDISYATRAARRKTGQAGRGEADPGEGSHQQTEKRHEISARLTAKVAELNKVDESFRALGAARTKLVTCSNEIDGYRDALKLAVDRLTKAKVEESAQHEKVRRLDSGDPAKELLLQNGRLENRRAALNRDLAATTTEIENLQFIKQAHEMLESLCIEVDSLTTEVDQLKSREGELGEISNKLRRQESDLLVVKSFIGWRSAKREFEAEKELKQLSALREQVRQKREAALRLASKNLMVGLPTAEELATLEQLHQELHVASAPLDVGLSVDINPKRRLSVAVSADVRNRFSKSWRRHLSRFPPPGPSNSTSAKSLRFGLGAAPKT